MRTGIRIIAQCYNVTTGKTVEETILRDEVLSKADTLKQLGYLGYESTNDINVS